jgi:YD repeat-containing protein
VTNVITTIAGTAMTCNSTLDQGPATQLCVFARSIDFAPDGAINIADNPAANYDRIRRLDLATGQMSTIAGVKPTSGCANMGDGGPAKQAALCNLTAHTTAPDGSIYLLDRGNTSNPLAIRKISTDGTIDTIGHANWSATDDAAALAVGPDGSLYVAQDRSVLRIFPTGELRNFAGVNANGDSGEGGPAVLAKFGFGGPSAVFVGPDGRVLIGDTGNAQVRMVDQQGIIRRVAGTNANNAAGNGGSPLNAGLGVGVVRSTIGPDGTMFITSRSTHTVRVVRPTIAGDFSGQAIVPSPSGSEVYRFDADGRHLETTSAANGALLYSFGYDSAKRLVSVTNSAGGVTVIERDEDGNPTRIIAPSGEETLLDTNALGYVTNLVGPDGAESELGYDAGGLLTSSVDPSGATHTYTYDADGRLLTP